MSENITFTQDEIDTLLKVDQGLRDGKGWQEIADELGKPLSSLFVTVKSLGYETGKFLKPIHYAPPIDKLRTNSAAA